jgi:hypothetical protein
MSNVATVEEAVTVTEAPKVEVPVAVEVKTVNENAAVFTERQVDKLEEAQAKLMIDPRRIVVIKERNTRQDKPANLGVLRQDFRENGVTQPVEVYISDGSEPGIQKGAPVLVTGYTRQEEAAAIADEYEKDGGERRFEIPYKIVPVPTGVKDPDAMQQHLLMKNIAENFFRNDLTDRDTINAILRLTKGQKEIGTKRATEIARYFGKSAAWVTQRLRMTDQLAPELFARLGKRPNEDGYIPGSVAMEIMKVGVPEGKKFEDLSDEEKGEVFAAQKRYVQEHEVPGAGTITRDKVKKDLAATVEGEEGTNTADDKPRTLKEIREEIISWQIAGAKKGEDKATDFSKDFIQFFDKKIGSRALKLRFEAYCGVPKKDRG